MDCVEQVVMEQEWPYDRPAEDELVSEVLTRWCDLRLWCAWNPGWQTLSCSWGFGAKVPERMMAAIDRLMALANERLMVGHFDMDRREGLVYFRHTLLLEEGQELSSGLTLRLFDIAQKECEQFYPAFQSVLWAGMSPEEAVRLSMFDTVGCA